MRPQTITEVLAQPLAIAPAALLELKAAAMRSPDDAPEKNEPQPLQATLYAAATLDRVPRPDRQAARSLVAVVPVHGVLSRHGMSSWRGTNPGMLEIERLMRELVANDSVGAIIMSTHSPGGTVTGTQELSQAIYDMRQQKRIVAVADTMMASAAMAVGSSASEIYAIPSATVGSIGVIADIESYARMNDRIGIDVKVIRSVPLKARFHPDEPITQDMIDTMQKMVDESHVEFVDTMARNRGVTTSHVSRHFGQGDVMTPKRAKDVGLIDHVARGGVDEVIALVAGQLRTGRAA